MEKQNGLSQQILVDFIKEDRNEIRIIKNRIYAAIQVLLVSSCAITSFFIERSVTDGVINLSCRLRWIIILSNAAFMGLSWVIFWVLNKDLHYVRQCLERREKMLTAYGVDYFGDEEEHKREKEKKCKGCETKFWKCIRKKCWKECNLKLWEWVQKKCWYTNFENDGILFFPMFLLSLVYVGVMAVVSLI